MGVQGHKSSALAPLFEATAWLGEVSLWLSDRLDKSALAAGKGEPDTLQFEPSHPDDGASDGDKFSKEIGLELFQLDHGLVADDARSYDWKLHVWRRVIFFVHEFGELQFENFTDSLIKYFYSKINMT
jgi:hypothetical protein